MELSQRVWTALEQRVTASTLQHYKETMRPLIHSELGVCRLQNITPEAIEVFTQERSRQVGPSSVNGSLRTLRRTLKLAVEWNLLTKAPKVRLLPNEHQREFIISDELLAKMLQHELCTSMLKKLIPFLVDTGLRISEALALTWEHVGLTPKQGASLGWVYVEKGKTKYAKRHVPLTERTLKILEGIKQASTSAYVFPAADGGQLTRHWPGHQFRALRNAMGLPKDCVVHSCRHTFCTRLGESGASAFVIQKLAGHSSILVSQRYVHPTPELLESAIGNLNELKN
jgi:site-specific recombinase XerD